MKQQRPGKNIARKTFLITASEVADYAYCERAWYLKRAGAEPEGQQLAGGSEFHARHGANVERAATVRLLAIASILLAIVLFIAAAFFSE